MKLHVWLLACCAAVLAGCCCEKTKKAVASDVPNLPKVKEARELITSGKAECVLVKENKIYAQKRGRGVSPLLEMYDTRRNDMAGAIIVDKVIGRAAAAVAICGKVTHVHGEVMSEDAVVFLNKNGISASATLMVPRILNQRRDDLCPLEKSVEGIDEPEKALAALRKRISELQTKARKGK